MDAVVWCIDRECGRVQQVEFLEQNIYSETLVLKSKALGFTVGTGHLDIDGLQMFLVEKLSIDFRKL